MPTCRTVIADALRAMKALAPGDDPTVDELNAGLGAFQALFLEWHECRGHMTDVDVSADYVAGADERIRVQNDATVNVTLPNAVPTLITCDPYDYGFEASALTPPQGTTASADGIEWRQPRDGERVEIVAANAQALYFYVADLNNWAWVYKPATNGLSTVNLGLDDPAPVNGRYAGHWSARLAERLIEIWPGMDEPSLALAKRIARANFILLARPGVVRDPVRADYF